MVAPSLVALPEELGQPRDVRGDPPRLVGGEHLGLMGLGRIVARAETS
jgi:hypothetical protein